MDKKKRKRLDILNVLKNQTGTVSATAILRQLNAAGIDFCERSIRMYLQEMDEQGLTESFGKKGRRITERGLDELRSTQISQRTGYLSAKLDQMTYRMDFDLHTRSGKVVINTSIVDAKPFKESLNEICRVFQTGNAMGTLLAMMGPGEKIGELTVPEGKLGFCTVCSVTLNGVLLKHGVPTVSRFGGLLELRDGRPTQFVEMIHYDGTSIDPLEVFIRSGMTNYLGAIKDGNGRIGASFREIPADARDLVMHLAERLKEIGLGAFMEIGLSGQPVLQIPVSEGRIGAIVIGGLNPVAILEERGHRVYSRALSGLLEYNRLFHFEELPKRLKELL